MEQKNLQTFNLDIKNFKEVYDYCYLNQIIDMNSFVTKCFKQGFDIQKYGMLGDGEQVKEVIKEVEKIVEIPVEKIVETIKEVEVVKYVDREVIKETPVTKIVEICDNDELNKTLNRVKELEDEIEKFSKIKSDLESQIQKFSTITGKTENIFQNNQDDKIKMLQNTLLSQKKELTLKSEKIKELEDKIKQLENLTINQGASYMRSSNLYKD